MNTRRRLTSTIAQLSLLLPLALGRPALAEDEIWKRASLRFTAGGNTTATLWASCIDSAGNPSFKCNIAELSNTGFGPLRYRMDEQCGHLDGYLEPRTKERVDCSRYIPQNSTASVKLSVSFEYRDVSAERENARRKADDERKRQREEEARLQAQRKQQEEAARAAQKAEEAKARTRRNEELAEERRRLAEAEAARAAAAAEAQRAEQARQTSALIASSQTRVNTAQQAVATVANGLTSMVADIQRRADERERARAAAAASTGATASALLPKWRLFDQQWRAMESDPDQVQFQSWPKYRKEAPGAYVEPADMVKRLSSGDRVTVEMAIGSDRSASKLVLGYLRLYDEFKVERAKLEAQRAPSERSTASVELLVGQLNSPIMLGVNGDAIFFCTHNKDSSCTDQKKVGSGPVEPASPGEGANMAQWTHGKYLYMAMSAPDGTPALMRVLGQKKEVVLRGLARSVNVLGVHDDFVYLQDCASVEAATCSLSRVALPVAPGAVPEPILSTFSLFAAPAIGAGAVAFSLEANGKSDLFIKQFGAAAPVQLAKSVADAVYAQGAFYWVTPGDFSQKNGTLMRVVPGQAPTRVLAGLDGPTGLRAAGDRLVWAEGISTNSREPPRATITTLSVTGGNPKVLATQQKFPQGFVVADGYLYWSDEGPRPGAGTVARVRL